MNECVYPFPVQVALTDACLSCTAGFATGTESGAAACISCDVGKFSKGLAVNCSTCLAGTYSLTSAPSCENCSSGTVAPFAGSSACTDCQAGKHQSQPGQTKCHGCEAGRLVENKFRGRNLV